MPRLSELQAQPRCPIICTNTDTDDTVQCARWIDHEPPEEHYSHGDVIMDMYIAMCTIYGIDVESSMRTLQGIILIKQAETWYSKLVITDDGDSS